MTDQIERARTFHALHVKGNPIVLYNAWDPGSAKIVEKAGAKAIATGSWPVAAAFGYADGEKIPLELALDNIKRIVAAVDLPVTMDLEGGYGVEPEAVAQTVTRALQAGAIGFNFEDQIVGGTGLHDIAVQVKRIEAAAAAVKARAFPPTSMPAPTSSSRRSRMHMTRRCSTRRSSARMPMKRPARAASLRRGSATKG